MKFPNHIIFDFNNQNNKNISQNWALIYLTLIKKNYCIFENFCIKKNVTKNSNFFFLQLKNQQKYTLKHSFYMQTIIKNYKITNIQSKKIKTNKSYFWILKLLNIKKNIKLINFKSIKFWNMFNINYLKKEKIYTKLKYSRTPQYDIVSGGVAAIFSGFLGFLICEKFGFELLDSGDLYILFMYIVFLCFFIKLLFKLINNLNNSWNVLSLKWFYFFYKNLFFLILKKINL